MKKGKKTTHTKEELVTIFKEQNVQETLFPKFLAYYKLCFDELFEEMKDFKDDDFKDGDSIQESALYCTNLYTKSFLELKGKGHSEEWAHLVAINIEDDEVKIYDAFEKLKKEQPQLAQQELILHCHNLNEDEVFIRYYLYLFENGEGFDDPFKRATIYAEEFKKVIGKGKSKLYAHEYAELMADENYHSIYCEEYAYAYEKAITEGKSQKYAIAFAKEYASELGNIKGRYGGSEDEESIDFAIEKVNAHMKAWEYVSENKLKDADRFYEIYENKHLNTYFANNEMPKGTLEEIDKDILEKTLLQYNKR